MRHVIWTSGYRWVVLLALVAVLAVAVGAGAQAANRGKVVRFWERQLHTGGTIQLLDYRVLRCGPRACVVRWHIRAFTPGDESDFGGFSDPIRQYFRSRWIYAEPIPFAGRRMIEANRAVLVLAGLRETCGMGTRIHFMGGEPAIDVSQSPDDVQKAITVGSRGAPFRVEHLENGQVYVNPTAIAYWYEQPQHRGADS